MAKKGSLLKTVIGLGSLAVAGKVAYDKYRNTKEKYVKEEKESADDVVKKYNAIAESKVIEIQDEEFEGCEIKASASKVVLDLSLAVIEKDVYINFKSQASSVVIVVPEGVNVTCDIEKVASRVRNEVINVDEEGIKGLVQKLTDLINNDGKVEKVDELGKKKLAYEIQKNKEGYYVVFNFEANPDLISELERNYRITDEVIKFMTIKVEE